MKKVRNTVLTVEDILVKVPSLAPPKPDEETVDLSSGGSSRVSCFGGHSWRRRLADPAVSSNEARSGSCDPPPGKVRREGHPQDGGSPREGALGETSQSKLPLMSLLPDSDVEDDSADPVTSRLRSVCF